jgi:integrase
VSPGCENCYAQREAHRQSGPGGGLRGSDPNNRAWAEVDREGPRRSQEDQGTAPLGTTGRLSAAPGRWFNRQHLRKELGITNKKLVLYSLRHTVTIRLLHEGVSESLISQLVGHTNNSMTSGRYGKSYPLKHMAEALEKLDWEV